MKLYEKIMFLRKQNGMSQEDLAFKLDVSRQSVYKWETGMSNPEMDKIKRLSEIFDISYNDLLNDAVDLGVPVESSRSVYRNTYDSGVRLTNEQADYYHGYEPESDGKEKVYKGKNKKSDEFYSALEGDFQNGTRKYTKTIRVQVDMLAGFFVDDGRGVIGFYWDDAEQFVCPYENIIDVSVINNGASMNYGRSRRVGVMVGAISGVGVGSQPVGQMNGPSIYEITISYFTKDGTTAMYKLQLGTHRSYIFNKNGGTKKDLMEYEILKKTLSMNTGKVLEEIRMEIVAARTKGERIARGSQKVEEVDLAVCEKNFAAGEEKRKQNLETIRANVKQIKKRKMIKELVGVGIVAVLLILLFALL